MVHRYVVCLRCVCASLTVLEIQAAVVVGARIAPATWNAIVLVWSTEVATADIYDSQCPYRKRVQLSTASDAASFSGGAPSATASRSMLMLTLAGAFAWLLCPPGEVVAVRRHGGALRVHVYT